MSHELSFCPSVLMRAQPYPQYALFLHCLCLLLPKSNLNRQVSTKAMFRSDKDSLRGGAACMQRDCLSGVFLTTRRGCPHAAPQSRSLYPLPLHATDRGCHLSELQCRTTSTFPSGPHCMMPAGPCSLFLHCPSTSPSLSSHEL